MNTYSASISTKYISPKSDPFGCIGEIKISGNILKGDAAKFRKALLDFCKPKGSYSNGVVLIEVALNSDGGDVDEAIEIGSNIRSKEVWTRVWFNDSCTSSCVFILAGGVEKSVLGKVGIHRPYFSALSDNLSIQQIQQIRFNKIKKINDYFDYVDIPRSLTDLMLSIPPEKIKILTEQELSMYRLSGADANYDEREVAKSAKAWGLTSAEYRKRDALVNQKCGRSIKELPNYNPDWQVCVWATMLNVSESEARDRLKKLRE